MDGFRPGGSLAFDRMSDGSVVIARLQSGGQRVASAPQREIVRFSHIIDPDTWAELIAYVSKGRIVNVLTEKIDSPTVKMAQAFHTGRIRSYELLNQ